MTWLSDHPWNVVFLVGFVIYVGIRHRFQKLAADGEMVVRRVDGLERGLLAFVGVGTLLLPVVYLFTPWLSFADVRLPECVHWCGAGLMVVALGLFWRSHADLGVNWSASLEVRRDHRLIRRGVYRSIRHPMYAAIWLFGFSQAFLLDNLVAGPAALVAFAPLYFVRVPREERLMIETFGDDYRRTIATTGRLMPRLLGSGRE